MAYLAIDLGAGSGRVIAGTISGGRLVLDELHRFPNVPVYRDGMLCWDFSRLFGEIERGIRTACEKGYEVEGIGVDTWGVDFALVDSEGRLLGDPVCYRDDRTRGMAEIASRRLSRERFYILTGIQQLEINTVYQLLSLQRRGVLPGREVRLLFMPDLINFLLTGAICNEYTIASTSQLLDARSREWSSEAIGALGFPAGIFQPIVRPGTRLGRLAPQIAAETGATATPVYAVGSHDTASAIGAIPATGTDWAFLSSGTWSLLGVTLPEPILSSDALAGDFTNEGGVDNKILFMRNVTGLWPIQRLMAEWEASGTPVSYETLLGECEMAAPFRSLIDGDDPSFTNPVSMSDAIRAFCRRTSQPEPGTRGELGRCVLDSLALKYRRVLRELEACTGRTLRRLYVVGGGSRNELLNRLIADASGLEVVTGLTEATATGNILQQAIASGAVADWEQARRIVSGSFGFRSWFPSDPAAWDEPALRAEKMFT